MKKIAIIGGGAAGLAAAVVAGEATSAAAAKTCEATVTTTAAAGADGVTASAAVAVGEATSAAAAGKAAGEAVRKARAINAEIYVYDADERIGRTILATGNGRCNFSNSHIDVKAYRNAKFVRRMLDNFEDADRSASKSGSNSPNGVVEFFEHHGMLWREEADGRLYPLANKASVVRDILLAAAKAQGVHLQTGCAVDRIEVRHEDSSANSASAANNASDGNSASNAHNAHNAHNASDAKKFTLRMSDGRFERADAVICACGGKFASGLAPKLVLSLAPTPDSKLTPELTSNLISNELTFENSIPVLCPIAVEGGMRPLDNIRVKAAIQLSRTGDVLSREVGEILFRKYGVSGIAVFNLSRLARAGDVLSIDFLPFMSVNETLEMLAKRESLLRNVSRETLTCGDFMRGIVLDRVADELLARLNLSPDEPYNENYAAKLAQILKSFDLKVSGLADTEHAQVHRGGFDVSQIDPLTMEVKTCPNLYIVGEALDVDGPCGGYNLHWAFASGIVAGKAAISGLL